MKFFIDTANLDEIRETNSLGVLDDVATCPFKVIMGLLYHPLTDKGLDKFLNDHKKTEWIEPL